MQQQRSAGRQVSTVMQTCTEAAVGTATGVVRTTATPPRGNRAMVPTLPPVAMLIAAAAAAVAAAAAEQRQQPEQGDTLRERESIPLRVSPWPEHVARPWLDRANDPPEERAKALLREMTLSEKLAMLHGAVVPGWGTECYNKTTGKIPDANCAYTGNVVGNARLGIPPLHLNDGPQGFRENTHPGTTTQFPSGLAVAASWDVRLMESWGRAMGKEFFAKGANVQLGPGVCVARVPNDGRNFEYLSGEDPFLGFVLAASAVAGIQSQKVIANAKHYVNNNQETNRNTVLEIVDERTRYEMYYPPFEGAARGVKGQPGVGSVMCSYNKVQPGQPASSAWSCENPTTLGDLKIHLNFSGWVMSDWDATHSTSLAQGLDQEMPGASFMGPDKVKAQLAKGTISQAQIDDSILRMLRPMFAVGLFDAPEGSYNISKHAVNASTAESIAVAKQLVLESAVLMKNNGVLPLLKPSVEQGSAVAGNRAGVAVFGLAKTAIYGGTGSGSVVPSAPVSPWDGITAEGSLARSRGFIFTDHTADSLPDAAKHAAAADVSLVFVGTVSGEGADRQTLGLGNTGNRNAHSDADQDQLVTTVCGASTRCVVVVCAPGVVLLPWAHNASVSAIITVFMPGQQFGSAIAELIFGGSNPSGKLPLTFPNKDNEMDFTPSQWPGTKIPPSGGFCKAGSYKVADGGCYNDTNHQCGFTEGFAEAFGTNNSWLNAATVCNSNGWTYAGAEDGQGAEVLCSDKPPTCPRVHDSFCDRGCPNNTKSGLNETCGSDWMLRLVNYTCEHEVGSFCEKVCDGVQCTPQLNSSYSVKNMGCFNDTGGGPNFDGACGFVRVGPGDRVNNSWEFAAQTCNQAGYSIAAVVDGLGAEIFCSNAPPTVGRNGCQRIEESASCNMSRTHPQDPAKPWVDYPCNACNATICLGHRDQTCGGASGEAYVDSVRALRVIEYTCKQQTPQPASSMPTPPVHASLGSSGGQLTEANYTERLLVGYRWYDAHDVEPLFAFGHGLSYTHFAYSGLKTTATSISCTIENTGKLQGMEVVQLYLSFPVPAGEPPQQLKGFVKIDLAPGASTEVTFPLTPRDLSIWSVATHAWTIVKGNFGVRIGASSRDIRLNGSLTV